MAYEVGRERKVDFYDFILCPSKLYLSPFKAPNKQNMDKIASDISFNAVLFLSRKFTMIYPYFISYV